jgi:hypothetical protein
MYPFTDSTGAVRFNPSPARVLAELGVGPGGGEIPSGLPEAPADGEFYARRNSAWQAFDPAEGGAGGIPEAPADGQVYGRQNEGWAALANPGGSSGGSGLIRYTVGSSAADSIIHQDVPVGTELQSAYASPAHRDEPGRMARGGALWRVIGNPPVHPAGHPQAGQRQFALGSIRYDVGLKRIIREGSVRIWEFVPDGPIHMAQLGLVTGDTAASLGQEALFAIVRDYVVNQNTLQNDNGIVGPAVDGDGILWTEAGDIDLGTMSWTAGGRFKFFAKNGFLKGGVPVPRVCGRHGRSGSMSGYTPPQSRFTLRSDVDIYGEGNQTSTLSNLTTRAIGFEHYNDTGSTSRIRYDSNRWYVGTRWLGNSEKQSAQVSGAYNDILLDYAQPFVILADYAPAGLTGTALTEARTELMQYILIGDDDRRGWQGEWNPALNQQGIVSGGYNATAIGYPRTQPLKGAFFRIKTSTGVSVNTSIAIDGRTNFENNRYLVFDGAAWFQMRTSTESPDSNRITLDGSDNEMIVRTPPGGDSSGIIRGEHESRRDRGGFRRAYQELNADGTQNLFMIPTPAIWSRHGKHMIWGAGVGDLWLRSGDQRVGLFCGKSARVDTDGYGLTTENLHGCNAWWDRVTNIYGQCFFTGGGNGRYNPGSGVVMAPEWNFAARVNDVVNAASMVLDIREKVADIGVVIGDEVRKLYPRGLLWHLMNVAMGNSEFPDPNAFRAIQVRACDGLHLVSKLVEGKLDYWAGAQGVHHEIPASFLTDGCDLLCDASADVGWKLTGRIADDELFGYDFGNLRYVQASEIDGDRYTGGVWQEGKWEFFSRPPVSQLALDSLASDSNRYFKRASASEMHKARHVPVYSTGDTAEALWQDAAGTVANTVDPLTGTISVRLLERTSIIVGRHTVTPPAAWINALDRLFFKWTECGWIPLDPLERGYLDAAGATWAPTRQGARLNLFGATAGDLALVEQNSANLTFTPYRGFQSTGDNYDTSDQFVSVRANAGWLATGYDPSAASRGMAINDMHAGAYVLTRHRTNAGEIGAKNDRLYVRGRDTQAAAVQMGVAGTTDRLETGAGDESLSPRHILGLARTAGEQRIYSKGRFMAAGPRTDVAMPDAITLLQSSGDDNSGANATVRHSPRQLGFWHVGRAMPEAMIRPGVAAIEEFERAVRKLIA